MWSSIFFFLFLNVVWSQKRFDEYLNSYDSQIRIWVSGYENLRNTGYNRGCCFVRNVFTCDPCRYRVMLHANQIDPNTLGNVNFFYEIGTYSKPAESLFESFYFEKIYSQFNMNDNEVIFYNTEQQSTLAIETMEKLMFYYYGDYEFDGSFGVLNRMRTWMVMRLTNLGFIYTEQINFVIQSIVVENNRLRNGECCSQSLDFDDPDCTTPCSFYLTLNDGNFDFAMSRDIRAIRNSRKYTYNLTIGFFASFYSFIDKFLNIKFFTVSDKLEIDTLTLRDLNLFRKKTYYYNNVVGVAGNIRANISISLYCVGCTGVMCQTPCNEVKLVDSCENKQRIPICLNGATDSNKCEKYSLSCDKSPCLNNGTCKIINKNRLVCICETGFDGKYCEDITCNKNCNNRGICSASNKCICEHPFFGDNCEFEVCDSSLSNTCDNGGLCYYDNGIKKCNCLDERFTGISCEIPLCEHLCTNGICVNNPETLQNICVCYEGFEGRLCDKSSSKVPSSKNSALLPLLIITAIGALLFMILSILKYKGIILGKKIFINDESSNID